MPWTLYRYILVELLKLLALTTVVLVVLISFAASIKPMSEGLMGGWTLLKFVGYSIPTMLRFALPFAGAFAATLVFLRLVNDNEILACSASGLSYRSILLPVFVLGLALTMGLFFLSNFVLPAFYRAASRTAEADMVAVIVHQLNEGRPVEMFGNNVLYADSALERDPPVMPDWPWQPDRLIELHGGALGQRDQQGRVGTTVTFDRASAYVFREANDILIQLILREWVYHNPEDGQFFATQRLEPTLLRRTNPLNERIKFFSLRQLRELNEHPDRFGRVREAKAQLAQAMAVQRLRWQIIRGLGSGDEHNRLTLLGVRAGEEYDLLAPVLDEQDGRLLLRGTAERPVVVRNRQPNMPERRLESHQAVLSIETIDTSLQPSVRIQLFNARIYDAVLRGEYTERSEWTLPRMTWPSDELLPVDPSRMSVWEMLQLTQDPEYAQSPQIDQAESRLWHTITRLSQEITAQLHERAATAVSCVLLLMLGAVLSMRMRGQMPLVVFMLSFLPAIVSIILVHTGENMATSRDFPLYFGLGVSWSGNVALAVGVGWSYCRLARN